MLNQTNVNCYMCILKISICFNFKVHAILKALPQTTQNEKRELDIETVKEQDDESGKKQASPQEQTSKGQTKK